MDWIALPIAILVTAGLAAAAWYIICFELWAFEKAYRLFESAALSALTKQRIRPDFWDSAILSWIYSWLAILWMVGGFTLALGGTQYGWGIFFIALTVWGIASRSLDHAKKPRPIDNPYLLMWWECGRLHPPPYVTFG